MCWVSGSSFNTLPHKKGDECSFGQQQNHNYNCSAAIHHPSSGEHCQIKKLAQTFWSKGCSYPMDFIHKN